MEELFVATEQGNIPIEQSVAEKYNLERGVRTPFSGSVIVDKNSNATPKPQAKNKKSLQDVEDESGVMLTTSEVLDFAAGADS